MLGESVDGATAGFRLGYENPAYFGGDYKKQFGAPERDIAVLRKSVGA